MDISEDDERDNTDTFIKHDNDDEGDLVKDPPEPDKAVTVDGLSAAAELGNLAAGGAGYKTGLGPDCT